MSRTFVFERNVWAGGKTKVQYHLAWQRLAISVNLYGRFV